jgi:hypothetical protein
VRTEVVGACSTLHVVSEVCTPSYLHRPACPRCAELQGITHTCRATRDARHAAQSMRGGPRNEPRGRVGGAVWLHLASALLKAPGVLRTWQRRATGVRRMLRLEPLGTPVVSGDDGPVATRGDRAAHPVLGRGGCARRRAVCRRR